MVQMVDDGSVPAWGSGTVISDTGLILTNAHVATPSFEIDGLQIAVSARPSRPPVPTYNAEVVTSDPDLDLAVIRVTTTLEGDPYETGDLPPVPTGDSDHVRIGQKLWILGYPAIGGSTVSFTQGVVSGFNSDPIGGERAWIKTDATIAGGNSGGMAVDRQGELIGVPTSANAAPGVPPTDCRPIRDTNQDGVLDDADNCVSLGGFLNGIRPVDLADAMIDDALAGDASPPQDVPTTAPDGFDPTGVVFSDPRFDGVTPEIPPSSSRAALPSDTMRVCAWWRFRGMADGAHYDAVWAHEGEIQPDYSLMDDVWTHGERGDYWVCFFDDEPVADGVWDLTLNVEGEYVNGGFVHVGDQYAPVDVAITNDAGASVSLCYLYLAPTVASDWGRERIGPRDTLDPGETLEISVPTGSYDLLAEDCREANVVEETHEITGPTQFTVVPVLLEGE
jgi:hypothetical protein